MEQYNFEKPNTQLHPTNVIFNESSFFEKNKEEKFSEKINHDTLFCSLVSKTFSNDKMMDSFFDLPDLPNNMENYFWQIPSNKNYEWIKYQDLLNTDGFTLKPIV